MNGQIFVAAFGIFLAGWALLMIILNWGDKKAPTSRVMSDIDKFNVLLDFRRDYIWDHSNDPHSHEAYGKFMLQKLVDLGNSLDHKERLNNDRETSNPESC